MVQRVEGRSAKRSNAYSIFILVLTLISLGTMVGLMLPVSDATANLLVFYDNAFCVVFFLDFIVAMARATDRRRYFFRESGWLDLLGSVPAFGFFRYTALLRLARLSRVVRIFRVLGKSGRRDVLRDVLEHRTQYAGFLTILMGVVVLLSATVVVLSAESRADKPLITTGWDAFWWSFVTITTVGYGDEYPVTVVGRLSAMFVMVMGVGIIGALASILASLLVGGGTSEEPAPDGGEDIASVAAELAALRVEVARLREALQPEPRSG